LVGKHRATRDSACWELDKNHDLSGIAAYATMRGKVVAISLRKARCLGLTVHQNLRALLAQCARGQLTPDFNGKGFTSASQRQRQRDRLVYDAARFQISLPRFDKRLLGRSDRTFHAVL